MDRDERLDAYVDGELGPADQAALEAEIAHDAALAAEVARRRALRARLAAAYDPVLEAPVPMRLRLAAEAANDRAAKRLRLPVWAAVAASLLAGVLVGRMSLPQGGPLVAKDGALTVRGDLGRALDGRLAADAGPVRVGLSFRTAGGGYCRTFRSAPDRLAGLACRQDGHWIARTTTTWTPGAGPDYRTAGADMPPEVLAAVESLIAGEPLDAAAERAARDRGWRP